MSYFRKFFGRLGFSVGLFKTDYKTYHFEFFNVGLKLQEVDIPFAYELEFNVVLFNVEFCISLWWRRDD